MLIIFIISITTSHTLDNFKGGRRQLLATTVSTQTELNNAKSNGAVLELGADIYLTATVSIISITITIDGMDTYKIDGQSTVRCFYVTGSASNVVTFQHLTITNGRTEGGAVYQESGSVVYFIVCTITNNVANNGRGGAFYVNDGAKLYLMNCTASGNTATTYGGVAYLSGTTNTRDYTMLTIKDSTFTGNTATLRGSVVGHDVANSKFYADVYVYGSTFQNNVATSELGGVFYMVFAQLWVEDSVFISNSATNGNGGVAYTQYPSYWERCTFDGNSAVSLYYPLLLRA